MAFQGWFFLCCLSVFIFCGREFGVVKSFLVGLLLVLCVLLCCIYLCSGICALSEMYPTKVRGLAMSIAGFSLDWNIFNWAVDSLMLQNLTPAGTFFLFAAMCVPYMLIVWSLYRKRLANLWKR